MSAFTLLAEVGDPDFERDLADALEVHGDVDVVPLPGHDGRPAGDLQPAALACSLIELAEQPPTLVAVGSSGWVAQVFALAGRVERLVLVDGLGGPWLSISEQMAHSRARRRALLADAEAMAPPPTAGLDPRTRHGLWGQYNRTLAEEACRSLSIPVLVVDTGIGALTESDTAVLSSLLPEGEHHRLPARRPRAVATAIAEWTQA